MGSFEERLRRLILEHGPISVARYMALALAHPASGYYPTRDPIGAAGDFVTAPEVSQLFGELIGLALVSCWLELGQPGRVALAELGPGRGTLMADVLRASRVVPSFAAASDVHLVETSPVLRERQAAALRSRSAFWHDSVDGLPADRPLLLVANEFLDALPVRQFVRRAGRWHERLVDIDGNGRFRFVVARHPTPFPEAVAGITWDAPEDTVLELGPARLALAEEIARRVAEQGGLALLIDYGGAPEAPMVDTFRAVRRHATVDPLQVPGEADLSAHVDFDAVAEAARSAGAEVYGPLAQGIYLERLGAGQRLERLLRNATPTQRSELESGHHRLVALEAMGELFKVLAITAPGGPVPAGFVEGDR
ncbi:MAG: class I SAM-dependent methyltransferase [Geminicoccaceae bacterium]